ncbi:bifunctional 5,10-methylenetetrahydrofolate dehydrogenase/5,10-methenyltetrahydrofolate cyclohydrolase [Candidatus Daviesbacteria bacterium]|nr:bifunctional 5,10-methylenetetrahydrofolate dehydrogenase/5,10-methenyltetrahydrofolate cyclohydrolase [Candidatus Daviesbacteria bacterium]
MKVSGRDLADKILEKLKLEIKGKNLTLCLAIILASNDPAPKMYTQRKINVAGEIGIKATLYEFSENQGQDCFETIQQLNEDQNIHGIIVQQPMHTGWDFQKYIQVVSSKKDVDGFKEDSPYKEATALGVWEMLSEFGRIEGFKSTDEFLEGKKIVVLGKGLTAGKPTINLLTEKGFPPEVIDSKTENPNQIIKNADVVISATGKKNIINGGNIKKGSFVIGIGVGKEEKDGEERIFGDINEEEIKDIAKLYCPTIGGIGPLTIACLLKNVMEASFTAQGPVSSVSQSRSSTQA